MYPAYPETPVRPATYKYKPYPAMRHNEAGQTCTVENIEEDQALLATGRWAKSPSYFTDRILRATQPVEEHLSYPVTLYATDGRWCLVQTEEEHTALGPGWYTSIAEAMAATTGASEEPTPEAEEAKILSQIHDATVEILKNLIINVTDIDGLKRLRAREAINPKHDGGRVGVMAAIDTRVAALQQLERERREREAEAAV